LLDEVTSYAPYKKYQAGTKMESIPADQMEIAQAGGLDQLLMRFSPVNLKTNAGSLSTIMLRGTSADHTSVNFGGININSLTLGHSNMAKVPVYLFDGIDLQYGSSSAVNGSGSIGGALYLGLKNNWTKGARVKATVSAGSFGGQLYGGKVFAGNGKFESVTRLFYFGLENDFPFKNPMVNGKVYNQQFANVENKGLIQEINYRFNQNQWFKSALWLEHDWHQTPWTIGDHQGNNGAKETLDNKHIRYWAEFENRKNPLKYKAGFGYVHDIQVYAANEDQKIETDRLIAELEANQDLKTGLGYKAGVKYRYVIPSVYAYSKEVIEYEHQADFYLMGFYTICNKLKLTLNLRQSFVTNFDAPFTPAVGAEYRIFVNEVSVLKAKGNVGKSYRVPTFNDRYWSVGGNPDLQPENGMNYELGFQYQYCTPAFQSDLQLNAFYMDVDDWVEWRPGGAGYWEAENRSRVISQGVEFQSNSDWYFGEWHTNFRANYSFNPTKIKDDPIATLIGRPLRFVPKHLGNAFVMINYRDYGVFVDGSYTGERIADYSGSALSPDGTLLDDYFLMNCGITKKLTISGQTVSLSAAVNNLLDKTYYNQLEYAMPGRSFRLSLSTDLNFDKN